MFKRKKESEAEEMRSDMVDATNVSQLPQSEKTHEVESAESKGITKKTAKSKVNKVSLFVMLAMLGGVSLYGANQFGLLKIPNLSELVNFNKPATETSSNVTQADLNNAIAMLTGKVDATESRILTTLKSVPSPSDIQKLKEEVELANNVASSALKANTETNRLLRVQTKEIETLRANINNLDLFVKTLQLETGKKVSLEEYQRELKAIKDGIDKTVKAEVKKAMWNGNGAPQKVSSPKPKATVQKKVIDKTVVKPTQVKPAIPTVKELEGFTLYNVVTFGGEYVGNFSYGQMLSYLRVGDYLSSTSDYKIQKIESKDGLTPKEILLINMKTQKQIILTRAQ